MPENPLVQLYRANAIASLASYLEETHTSHELSTAEVQAYDQRSFAFGWELRIQFCDQIRRVHILVSNEFPFSAPKIALVDRPEFLQWPHVERDGVLCLLPNNATVSPSAPVGVVQDLLASAVQLIEDSIAGRTLIDFETEFHTYWGYEVSPGSKPCFSLLDINPGEDRIVRSWEGKNYDVIGESVEQIRAWLKNRDRTSHETDTFTKALIIWMTSLPHPAQYPKTAADVFRLVGPRKLFEELITDTTRRARIILAGQTSNGLVAGGVLITVPRPRNAKGKGSPPLSKGFRPGKAPSDLLQTRLFQTNTPVALFNVNRADHFWIHGRDHDPSQKDIKACCIVIAGCGSLGSSIAAELAKAGVGTLHLVDPENLEWANVSRHVLGAQYVGCNKATALAEHLGKQFPHLRVEAHSSSIENWLQKDYEVVTNSSLVINATAAWGATSLLDMLQNSDEDFPSALHGWMERGAAVGHAVLIRDGLRLKDGFDDLGQPLFQLTKWDKPLLQEPACGAVFEPYGSSEVARSATLAADFAIDYVSGDPGVAHRMWIGSRAKLTAQGGEWSPQWRSKPHFREEGGLYVSQKWHGCSES